MTRFFAVFGLFLLLAGCGSTVPLTDVPVADATAKAVSGADAGASATGAAVQGNGVASVDLTKGTGKDAMASAPRIVYFDYDSYVVKPEFQALIATHAKYIRSQPGLKVVIEGHTDESGGREYNLALGQKRSDAVRDALAILGVSKTQLESVSYGKEKPAVMGSDEAAFAKNRRAEIRYQ